SPVSGCWLSQREKLSLITPPTKAADSREESLSFVCPENCGFSSLALRTKLRPSQTSSGESCTPRGNRLRNSQYSRSAVVSPVRMRSEEHTSELQSRE